jgi:hypothetical protein
MSQPKINPATGYVHDDSQLEGPKADVIDQNQAIEPEQEEKQEASE